MSLGRIYSVFVRLLPFTVLYAYPLSVPFLRLPWLHTLLRIGTIISSLHLILLVYSEVRGLTVFDT